MKKLAIILIFLLSGLIYADNPCERFGSNPYELSGYSWDKSNLKYYFLNFTEDLTQSEVRQTFQDAFNKWEIVSGIEFNETSIQYLADIIIIWHVDGDFHNTNSIKAHTYYPPPYHVKSGYMEFNENVNWKLTKVGDGSTDLRYVAAHEIGHVLGLCHSNTSTAMMYYPVAHKLNLSTHDINGIKSIYCDVFVKNLFKNPDGSEYSGGNVNIDNIDFNSNNEPNNEVHKVFNIGSQRRFEAKTQTLNNMEWKFNNLLERQGGWRFNDQVIALESVLLHNVTEGNYSAKYKYKAQISLSAFTEFDNIFSYGTIGGIFQFESGSIEAPSTITPTTITYNFAGWSEYLDQDISLTITPTENKTIEALYKIPNYSNNSNGFSSSSQSKLVKTSNGYLHRVYESMDYVWYERSTDNGSTWILANSGKPISAHEAKSPSIDYYGNNVFIVFQEKYGSNYKIMCVPYDPAYSFNSVSAVSIYEEETDLYTNDAAPIIGVGHNLNGMIIWKKSQQQLKYWLGALSFVTGPNVYGTVPNTNSTSSNPTVLAHKNVAMDPYTFYVAWQQGTSAIKYERLVWDEHDEFLYTFDYVEPSYAGPVYYYNVKPSISLYANNYPVVTWIRNDYDGQIRHCALRLKIGSSWSQFYSYSYGYHMESVNTNNSDTDGNFIVAMAGTQNNDQYIKSNSTTAVYILPTKGEVQVSNGNGFSGMRIQSFDKYNSPHGFTLHGTNGMLKSESNQQLITGRELGMINEVVSFKVCLYDIKVDDELITFPNTNEFSNSIAATNFEDNFISNAFMLTDNSNFTFGLDYYFENPSSSTQNSTLKLKINLVDAETNNILESLKEVVIDKSQGNISDAKYFSVNTNGIGSRNVKLQMKFFDNSNLENEFTVTTKFTEFDPDFMKQSIVELTLDEIIITNYALAQNYPNPFNPTTTIDYQIPNDGVVSLKIYDMLGKEVMTLVDRQQSTGRYTVQFDASHLSSGVYIYRIQANDYVASKKMMLLK